MNHRKKILRSKSDTRIMASDNHTDYVWFHLPDTPVYDSFEWGHPIRSGLGSLVNVPGNYYSFHKYLERNDDYHALQSDWQNVGLAFWDALYSLDKEIENATGR